ncbi:hypothetical protein FWH30_00795 [Microgenomates group bacterium]|nr:hypothetical protein [Microgenomates group bacterium]
MNETPRHQSSERSQSSPVMEIITPDELKERYGIEIKLKRPVMAEAVEKAQERKSLPAEERRRMAEEAWRKTREQRREEKMRKSQERRIVLMAVFGVILILIGGLFVLQDGVGQVGANEIRVGGVMGVEDGSGGRIERDKKREEARDEQRGGRMMSMTAADGEQEREVLAATTEVQQEVTADVIEEEVPEILVMEEEVEEGGEEEGRDVAEEEAGTEMETNAVDITELDFDLRHMIETDAGFIDRAKEVLMLIEQHPDWEAPVALSMVVAENRQLDPRAVNTANSNGSVDRGLFQINSIHGFDADRLFDSAYNVDRAHWVWENQGWRAWSTYNEGLHMKYLNFYDYLKGLG